MIEPIGNVLTISGAEYRPVASFVTASSVDYTTIDVAGAYRLHVWNSGGDAKYAVGFGPIEYITRERFDELLGRVYRRE